MVQNQVESFSSWEELIKGAPEGPVLGPILLISMIYPMQMTQRFMLATII